jgi:hypothetical protein
MLSHYTFARADKYDSGYYPNSHTYSYGPDDQVRNHVWVTNFVYELPFGKGKPMLSGANTLTDTIFGGWQVTGTTNVSSGLPWTPSFSSCGQVNDLGLCRPVPNGSFHMGPGPFNPYTHQESFFTPIATMVYPTSALVPGVDTCTLPRPSGPGFSVPGCGQLGTIGFDPYRGPRGFWGDAAIMKNFTITERWKAQFRMDAFNLFNHPVAGFNANQTGTGNCIDCAGNGNITDIEADSSPGSTTGMRQLEFALKIIF